MVVWSTSMPRSARSSSTSRYDSAKRRYQRTERTITSGGKQKPAKADRAREGRTRRVLMTPVWLLWAGSQQMQQSRRRCQRSSVPGLTKKHDQRARGRTRLIAASRARSVGSSLGRGIWRRSTPSWWRSTRSSKSLAASPRASVASSWMGTVALSDHPVRLPPLRRSKTTDHGTVEWFEPFVAAFHEGEPPLCWASPAHSGSMQQCLPSARDQGGTDGPGPCPWGGFGRHDGLHSKHRP